MKVKKIILSSDDSAIAIIDNPELVQKCVDLIFGYSVAPAASVRRYRTRYKTWSEQDQAKLWEMYVRGVVTDAIMREFNANRHQVLNKIYYLRRIHNIPKKMKQSEVVRKYSSLTPAFSS